MAAHLHHFLSPKPPLTNSISSPPSSAPSSFFPAPRRRCLRLRTINRTGKDDDSNSNGNGNSNSNSVSPTPGTVEVRFRRRSRRRRQEGDGGEVGKQSTRVKDSTDAPKKWEEMSVGEKALELYVGEKGLLFWLNKFAYASIFIVIGCWILFRFVGPSLNLYQLDTPPLSPSSVFKGS